MMAGSAAEEKTFRRFLELFLREMRMPLQESDPVPMRPLSDLVTEDEEGEEAIAITAERIFVPAKNSLTGYYVISLKR
ncbi:hypothetical protein D9C73_017375 [Collichthys lucidus]|uniref:Uncharacterized protein n=1 Tax=Collichthys lucidus TaxID=240159 RepID=A0A4U5V980_COLLU|nr:hypothetical protein D9C73_017375 [Collichthys lucidus]